MAGRSGKKVTVMPSIILVMHPLVLDAQYGTGSSQTNDATSGPPQCKLCHLKLAVGSVTTQTGSDERGTSSLKYPLLARG